MAKRIIIDETIELQRVMKEGFFRNTINTYDLSLLAKYYRSLGYGFAKIKITLIEFCKCQDKYFSSVLYRDQINKALKKAKEETLKTSETSVIITKKELDILKSLNRNLAQILFTMLVLAKHAKFHSPKIVRNEPENIGYYCYHKMDEIIKRAKAKIPENEIDNIKYELDGKRGLISATSRSWNWKICFAEDNSEPVLEIKSLIDVSRNLPWWCEKCGCILEKTNNRHKMCENCWKEKQRELSRNGMRNLRNKKC